MSIDETTRTFSSSDIANKSTFPIDVGTKRLDVESTDKASKNLGWSGSFEDV